MNFPARSIIGPWFPALAGRVERAGFDFMKSKLPKKIKVLSIRYGTTNPAYPNDWKCRYNSRRLCDAMWGRRWTRKIWEVISA